MSSKQPVKLSKITKAGADDEKLPKQQMEYMGKVADGIMIFPYGMHANIPADVLALMFAVGGDPDNRSAIGFMDPAATRPTLADGEAAFYHPPTGNFIIWRANGNLEVELKEFAEAQITSNFVSVSDNFAVGSGASGSFSSGDGKVITVQDGVIIGIV